MSESKDEEVFKCPNCEEEIEEPSRDMLHPISNTFSFDCPKCKLAPSLKFNQLKNHFGFDSSEEIREHLAERKREEELETKAEGGEYTTPNELLEEVLEIDPKISEEDTNWIMKKAKKIYKVMTANDLKDHVKHLDINKKNIVANRVANDYLEFINNHLNENPSAINSKQWKQFLEKEPKAPNPEEIDFENIEQLKVAGTPTNTSTQTKNTPPKNDTMAKLENIDMDRYLNEQLSRMEKINMIKALGDGNIPDKLKPMAMGENGGEAEQEIDDILKKTLRRQMTMQTLQSFQGNNGKDEELKKEIEKMRQETMQQLEESRMQHEKEMKKMEREIAQIKSDGGSQRQQQQQDPTQQVKQAVQSVKELEEEFGGRDNNNGSEMTEQITAQLQALRSEMAETVPSGETMDQHTAEVKKTEAEVQGEKEKANLEYEARMKEAKEQRKGLEELASSLESSFRQLGEGLGIGLAGPGAAQGSDAPPPTQPPTTQPNPSQPPQQKSEKVNLPVEREVIDGEETGNLKSVCQTCGAEIVFPETASLAECEECGEQYRVNPLK